MKKGAVNPIFQLGYVATEKRPYVVSFKPIVVTDYDELIKEMEKHEESNLETLLEEAGNMYINSILEEDIGTAVSAITKLFRYRSILVKYLIQTAIDISDVSIMSQKVVNTVLDKVSENMSPLDVVMLTRLLIQSKHASGFKNYIESKTDDVEELVVDTNAKLSDYIYGDKRYRKLDYADRAYWYYPQYIRDNAKVSKKGVQAITDEIEKDIPVTDEDKRYAESIKEKAKRAIA